MDKTFCTECTCKKETGGTNYKIQNKYYSVDHVWPSVGELSHYCLPASLAISLLQIMDLDVMMEVVDLAVAQLQINVQLVKETVTKSLTAKMA